MENKIYGYVRVSSTDQNEDRQMMALNKVNVPEKNICPDSIERQKDHLMLGSRFARVLYLKDYASY